MAKLEIERRDRELDYSYRNGSKQYWSNARIYFFVKDETILDNLINRRSRPMTEYRKLLPSVFAKAGLPTDTKVKWRQTAGCSCGCSPGFIIDNMSKFDVFVTIHPDNGEVK